MPHESVCAAVSCFNKCLPTIVLASISRKTKVNLIQQIRCDVWSKRQSFQPLDRNYHHRSMTSQIPHIAGWISIPYLRQKISPRGDRIWAAILRYKLKASYLKSHNHGFVTQTHTHTHTQNTHIILKVWSNGVWLLILVHLYILWTESVV